MPEDVARHEKMVLERTVMWMTDSGDAEWIDPWGQEWFAAVSEARRVVRHKGDEAEACGLVLAGNDGRTRVVVRDNVSDQPGTFRFSVEECFNVAKAMESGSVLGVWHSHPAGHREPSAEDWMGQPFSVDMYIVVLEPDQALVLRFTDDDRP